MPVSSLSSLLAATVAFAIGTSVVLRDRRRSQFIVFAIFCFNLGLFHLARFLYGFSGAFAFGWLAQSISLLLPWSADRCFSSLVPATGHRGGGRLQAVLLATLLVAQAVSLLFPELTTRAAWDIIAVAAGVYVLGGLVYATTRMWRAAKATEGTAVSPKLRYLFYASLLAMLLGSPLIPQVGPIVTAVYLYFVAQTLVRERLLDLPEVVGQIASMTLLVLAVTFVFALLLLWIPTRGGGNRQLFLFNLAVASFTVIVLVDPIRTEFESRIESWLFRDRTAMRGLLVQLRLKLAKVIDLDDMVGVLSDELRGSNRVTRASLYLQDRQGLGLVLRSSLGPKGPARLDFAVHRPLLERMRSSGALLRDVLQREHDRAHGSARAELAEVLETLGQLGASLSLPIVASPRRTPGGVRGTRAGAPFDDRELLGALFVDDERLLEPFSRQEVELFEGVVAQAAITIQNSAVYEQRNERDRLAALGEMAAGLAHEIRNPLGAIKGAIQVVEPALPSVDPHTREFLGVILEEVERLNRVVSQFLSYSRPFKGELTTTMVVPVIDATLRLLDEAAREKVTSLLQGREPPPVLADAEALRQVLHNLLLNALDAVSTSEHEGRVWILRSFRPAGLPTGDAVAITIRDNGPGLSQHTLSHLFVPFHTTKTGGTGLGLPICQRIVDTHHGRIEVHNHADGGAEFSVLLPAATGESPP